MNQNDIVNLESFDGFDQLAVNDIKKSLLAFIDAGQTDRQVIDLLLDPTGRYFAPIEGDLLDYKLLAGTDKAETAKTVLQIVSLHNSYGGFLVYGVSEISAETEFRAVGVEKDSIDVKQLKDKVRAFTGESIDITLQYISLTTSQGVAGQIYIALLLIPKRSHHEPIAFGKDSPGINEKYIFRSDDIYFRKGDECLPAKGKDMAFLNGPRIHSLNGASLLTKIHVRKAIIDHNLPDRSFICSQFFGRKGYIDMLWEWSGDEFSRVRVLAGEGGLGKTSIAYEFAQAIVSDPPEDLQQVVWVTAKRVQFSGITNASILVPETHFSTFSELLAELCARIGCTDDEITGASDKMLQKFLKEALTITPCLVVVDDVDSLPTDDQKKVLEMGMSLSGTKSRLLMTTRFNQTYSSNLAIPIDGLDISNEYPAFVENLQKRYPYANLAEKQIKRMHDTTAGSPLFTESLYRLFRDLSVDRAIQEWKGKHGEDARSAALKREIDQLSPEAKRVIVVVALLAPSCSLEELAQTTSYGDVRLMACIDELSAMFLVSAPAISTDPRYTCDENTRTYVTGRGRELIGDYVRVEANVRALRKDAGLSKQSVKNRQVGLAIRQASAQLRAGKPEEALETVKQSKKSIRANFDLLTMEARIFLEGFNKPDEARKLLRKCFDLGSRKDLMFRFWFDAEKGVGHNQGALEAAQRALDSGAGDQNKWRESLIEARFQVALDQKRLRHFDRAFEELWLCVDELATLRKQASADDLGALKDYQYLIHDEIWQIASPSLGDVHAALQGLDFLARMHKAGDLRMVTFKRFCNAVKALIYALRGRSSTSLKGLPSLTEQKLREVRSLITGAKQKRPNETRFSDLLAELGKIEGERVAFLEHLS